MKPESEKKIALVTPSHSKDLERFALLCESIDRLVNCYERHYAIVNDDDVSAFAEFAGPRRVIMPSSRLLPRWLKPMPSLVLRKGRRLWWSFKAKPVHGWHVQQILKIAAAAQLPEQRFCFIYSDNVFVRPFDVAQYAGRDRTPLYIDRAAITAESPLHAPWIRNSDDLLGKPEPTAFPADDYIGNVIVWDKSAVRGMIARIERSTGIDWALALCRKRAFSEYLLYGQFVRMSPEHAGRHEIITESLANAHWDAYPLDANGVQALVAGMSEREVALCIESFSGTSVSTIRDTVGLSDRQAATIQPDPAAISDRKRSDVRVHQQG
jgi:hypothetical protein